MDQLDDLPDPPEGASDPFAEPAPMSGGYLGGNDDDAVKEIRRRISPFGKVMIVVVLAALGGTGYFVVNSQLERNAIDAAQSQGRTELARITSQPIAREEIARQVRDAYRRFQISPEVRMSARRILAALHDNDAMPIFVEGLRQTGRERQQSALAIAEIGLPAGVAARDALAEALPHTDPVIDQAEVAWAMVVVQDPRAWDTVVSLIGSGRLQQVNNLDDPPHRIFDPGLVARMAGRDRLVQLASDSHVPVRRIAAVSLAELASPEVFETLVTLSRDSDADVAREAAIGLGRTGIDRGAQPIVDYLTRHPDSREAVLTALSQNAGAPGLGVVARSNTEPTTRNQAVRLLRELHDPGAGDVFVALLGSIPADTTDEVQKTIRKNAIFGLAEIGDSRAADGLMELAQRPLVPGARVDPNVDQDARLALDALRKIPGAPARAKAGLLAMLPHADFMRTQILLALGEAEDPSIGPQLMTFLADPQAQEGAAVAVCRLHYAPGMARVRADVRRPLALHMVEETVQDEPVFVKRRNAIRAIGWTHDPHLAADLERVVDDPLDRALLREEAGFALASIADDNTVTDIANRALDTTKPEDARTYYLYALRARSNPATSTRLIEAYLRPGQSTNLMHAAAIAAGFGGDSGTAAVLRPLLASNDSNVKLNAGIASVLCGDEPSAAALLDQLTTNTEFANLMANVFVTRSATGNNSGVELEPFELMPLTQSMFADGRVYHRVQVAALLEHGRGAAHEEFAMVWLRTRLKNGWENPQGIGGFEVRGQLRHAAAGTDAFQRDMAFRMLRAFDDRGSLLWLRRQGGEAAERARRELVQMNSQGG